MNRYSEPSRSSRPHLPTRRARRRSLVELASPSRAPVFRRLDYALWRATAHNPVRMLRADPAGQARGRGRGSRSSSGSTTARSRRSTTPGRRATPGGRRGFRSTTSQVDRLLLGRVRAASVAADLRRRPGRAGRRSLQGGGRPRRAADRRRLHVSAGLLPPAHLGRRLAGGELRAPQLGGRADRAGDDAATAGRASRRCRSAIARCWWRSGACAWAA